MNNKGSVKRDLRKFLAVGRMPFSALSGLWQYSAKGRISTEVWNRLLWAHCASNGRTTDLLNLITRTIRPARSPQPVRGLLGDFSVERQKEIKSAIERDGFYVFPELISPDFLDSLQDFSGCTPAVIETNRDRPASLISYDPNHPVSRTYKIREKDALQNVEIQQLVADPVFVAIAEAYLQTLPAIGGVDVWWSALYGNQAGSDAAQLFHFDFDAPPAWLKLFVYVTDVTPDTGPHVYVKGTHKAGVSAAREFRSRGYERISDEEIEAMFGSDNLIEIIGKRGTVFLADTRGFHKGKYPTHGDRLIAQVIYCSPIFNHHSEPPHLPENPVRALVDAMSAAPRVYERYMSANR
jgi:hypothetical protein